MFDRGGKLVFLALILLTNSYGKACSSIPTLEPNMDVNRTWFVHMGDNVTINCIGGPGASGKYHSHLKWELANGESFPGNVKTLHLEDRHRSNITCDVKRLSITSFEKDNNGEYYCIRNETTSPNSTSSTVVRIDMTEPSAPYIQINVSKTLRVVERTAVTLPCFATGSPKPSVKWWSDDRKESLPCIIKFNGTCHDLACINFTCYWNVTVSRNMTYWCEAKNKYGVIERNVSVEVLEKPSLLKDLVDIENNKFFCSAPLVHPPPTFRWKYHESFNCTTKEECVYHGEWLNATAPDFEGFSTIQNKLVRTSLVVRKRPIKAVLQCIASNEVGSVNRTIKVCLQADETASNKMNEVVMIGIIIGVLLVLLIVVLMAIYVLKRQTNQYAKFMSPYSDYQLKSDVSLMEQGLHLPYDTSWEYPRDKLEFIKVLGSGAFGQVWLARAMHLSRHSKRDYENNITIKKYRKLSFYDYVKKTSKNNNKGSGIVYVAVKTLKDDATESEYKDLASEIKVLIYIGKHCNIVNLLGACTRNGSLFSIMEYCPYGNLKSFLKSKRDCYSSQWCTTLHELSESLTLGDLASIIYQIARGLEFLHSKELIHRDLAARNILLGEQYCVKISDFGLARDIALNENYVKTTSGLLPYKWMSPESMIDRVYNKKSDIWSFGIVLWEIFTLGGTPYPGIPVEHLYEYIQCGRRMEQPETCPEEFFYIMLNCWAGDPNQRKGCSLVIENIDEILKTKLKDNPYLCMVNDEWGSQLTLARNDATSPVSPVTFKKKFSWVSVMEIMGNKKPRPVSRSEDHLLSSRLSSTNSDNEKNEV